jgi:hypothetical protein
MSAVTTETQRMAEYDGEFRLCEPRPAIMLSPELVVQAAEVFEDGYRVRDLDLGDWLRYADLTDIRQVIRRNQSELERHGPLTQREFVVERPQGGGSRATEYWLNEEQVITVCLLARTERAMEVRVVVTQAFVALRHGKFAPVDGALFLIVAAWNLTPAEQAVMRQGLRVR